MWPYWIMFLLPAFAAYQEAATHPEDEFYGGRRRARLGWWVLATVIMILLVGWRHEVGGDWVNYIRNFYDATYDNIHDALSQSDPSYHLLEWLAISAGWDIHGVNLIASLLFSGGLTWFCYNQPRPWLALTVAIPYLVIVVGMGYTRQAVALGCTMFGLVALGNARVRPFVLWTVFGATFHKSAVLMLPMAALAASRRRLFTATWVAIVIAVAYSLLIESSVETLRQNYLQAEYESQGALVRVLMNAVPATIFLWRRNNFGVEGSELRLWFWMSLTSIALLFILFLSPSSTAVDRLAIYMLPLQVFVFSRLPEALGSWSSQNRIWVQLVLIYYIAVQFVWLNFAINSGYWIPYKLYVV